MMLLKDYQNNAIKELLGKAKKLITYGDAKRMVFKAPTASGKTIMMAEFLKQLCEDREVLASFSLIWTAPRQLHIQSKDKLEQYYETSRALRCSLFEELDDKRIDEGEILFFNWESINKNDNIYIRENEQDNNLSNVISRTKEEGRIIVLVIDESHHHATSEISQNLIRDIDPKLTIEVSATPAMESPDEIVSVQLEDVKAEAMIKKAVILNPDFENVLRDRKIQSQLSKQSEELVIETALKKRDALKEAYKKERVGVNPLILIQLPDRKTSLEDVIKDKVIAVLKNKHKITAESGKLAIHLAEHKENLDDISDPYNEVEVLIFKQALALGWDCPRAHILVLFRDWQSFEFSIQTIGRIMRMPEPDHGHYDTEILNYGYVFTNIESIEIQEDLARDYITIHASKRGREYSPLSLLSCHSKRYREKTRLAPIFIKVFLQETAAYSLSQRIRKKAKGLSARFISDYKAENVDALAGASIIGDRAIRVTGWDLQKYFDYFIRKSLAPFYAEDRSIGRLKEAIYEFFEQVMGMRYEVVQEEIVQTVLSEGNLVHFINVIDQAKDKYIDYISRREKELEFDQGWEVPETIGFNARYAIEDRKKSIMHPFFKSEYSGVEAAFMTFLDEQDKVVWWFKNEAKNPAYFAVLYEEDGDKRPFYVDFIVQLKDGLIGLFDTKAGLTQKVAGPKVNGLRTYVGEQNKKGKRLFGGIVTNTDGRNYAGRWVYFNREGKELSGSLDNWETLAF
ncbi:MAG: DEAD/DEAH box helicase family protein [Candidatus Omnitrophica bacterium]|nr:DEAD/DEAH box helicase family protein [Candidatus Omnitrophota bacterium]